ncbi:ATP-binding protein [Actinocorallia libanotica]|uniref:Tetratricopeptide repeat protein n=1 Tax=Actinocorallia libanotica TaxID=46162 RepID=A0ABP4C7H6_9ACTN
MSQNLPSPRRPASETVHNEASEIGSLVQAGSIEELHFHQAPRREVVPRLLPGVTGNFTGRTRELTELDRLLEHRAAAAGTASVCVLSGMPGVGKTVLAVWWGHLAATRFPHGQLYVDLQGFHASRVPLEPGEVLHLFLSALGVEPHRIPVAVEEKVQLYRSLLNERRVLVVLDNAASTDQITPLLPGASSCTTVVTSRRRLSGLVADRGARSLAIRAFDERESGELMARYLGSRQVEREHEACSELVELCGGLPLALGIVAAQARIYNSALRELVDDLRAEHDRLSAMDLEDGESVGVSVAFSLSYSKLQPDQARFFRLVGLSPGPEFSPQVAASLAGVSLQRARSLLRSLSDHNLIEEVAPRRYRMHDLIKLFARNQADEREHPQARRQAIHRLLDFLLVNATAADRILTPHRTRIEVSAPEAEVPQVRMDGYDQAIAWLESEYACLIGALSKAAETGFYRHTWQLAWTLGVFFDRRGHAVDRRRTGEWALTAAQSLGDRQAEALVRASIGSAHSRVNEFGKAVDELGRALAIFQNLGLTLHEADTLLSLAIVDEESDRYEAAKVHLHRALTLYRAHGERFGEAHALENLGWSHAHLGEYPEAIETCDAAVEIFRELGDPDGEADTLDSLGYVYARLDRHEEALAHYHRALALWQGLGNRYDEADVLTRIGDSHAGLGDSDGAREAWIRALAIFDELSQPDAELLRARLAS